MRQFLDRERIAARLVKYQLAYSRRDAWSAAVEHLGSGRRIERFQIQYDQAGLLERAVIALADRRQQHDGFELEPTRYEREYVRRRGVEPLGVLRDDEQWALGGGLGQQLERRQRSAEEVRPAPFDDAERRLERHALRLGQLVDVA
jgi:hypothetical protein